MPNSSAACDPTPTPALDAACDADPVLALWCGRTPKHLRASECRGRGGRPPIHINLDERIRALYDPALTNNQMAKLLELKQSTYEVAMYRLVQRGEIQPKRRGHAK